MTVNMEQAEIRQDNAVKPAGATEQPVKNADKRPKSKWRRVWRFFVLLLILILTPVLFLFTEKGQQTALSLASRWVEGLSIGEVQGSLQNGLQIQDARYRKDGVDVSVGQAQLHIGFACLTEKQACIENLALSQAKIVIDSSKLPESKEEKNTDWTTLSLPVAVSLKQIRADDIQVSVDETEISLKHFHSGISGKEKLLSLSETAIDRLVVSLAPQAVANQKENAKKAAQKAVKGGDWTALEQTLGRPLLTKLDPIRLPLDLEIPDFKATNLRIEQRVKGNNGQWAKPELLVDIPLAVLQAKSDAQKIEVARIEIQSDKGNVSGNGQLTLSGNYPLQWQLKGSHPAFTEFKIPASRADVNLSGELFGETKLTLQSEGAAKFSLNGVVRLSEAKTPFNLVLKSDELRYPFVAEKGIDPLKIQGVDLTLSGDLLNYRLDGKLAGSGMNLPSGKAVIKGSGAVTHFNLDNLTLNALDGETRLAGKIDWRNGVEWNSEVKLSGVNTKAVLPQWAALLNGTLQTKGYAARDDAWVVEIDGMNLDGTLFQKKLRLTGTLRADHKTLLQVPNASLIYGENVIDLKGQLGEKSDFLAEINAPNLKGLIPNFSGGLSGKVKMKGKLTEPGLDLDLTANNVAYEQHRLQRLTAKGKVTTERQIIADLNIGIQKLSSAEIKMDQVELSLKGSEANHTLKLSGKGTPVGGDLQISGKFDRLQEIWQGQLSQITLQTDYGNLQNDKPIQVNYQNKLLRANISAHCWRHPQLSLCFPQAFQAGEEGKIPFEIKQFDLASLQPYLDKNTQLIGQVSAKGDAAWFKNSPPKVNVELFSHSIKANQKIDGRLFPLSLTPVKVAANLADNALKMKTEIKVENNGRLNSDLLMKDLSGKRTLSGNIAVERLDLNLVKPLLSGGETLNGEINARLTVGGNVSSPLLYGQLNLNRLRATSTVMPFDIIDGGLTAQFNGASSTLKGNIKTKESQLSLSGDANWQNLNAWHTRIKANANRFRLDVPGIAKVDITPDIEVRVDPNNLKLNGHIDIPWARIEVQELPESAVSVSGDEVIMDGSVKQKKSIPLIANTKNRPQNGQGMAIKGDISINIGNDVHLEAYGLKSNLQGLLKVRQGNKGLGLYGQVNLKNGTFASFGQDLIIRKGVISFTGLPSQPTLDIEAIRNPEAIEDPNVTAGVRVTGLADDLDVKVFASPSMPQDQALSYILTGRGLENSGDAASGNSVAAALIGMSLSKGSKTVGSIGSAFGISDFNVTTAGIGDNTKVVVSGSLTPKFKVKYGVGIFAPLTELTLRYRLAPSLYLQWVSSINQAVDLLYRFEFD